jgi:hypothetical protein
MSGGGGGGDVHTIDESGDHGGVLERNNGRKES